MFKCDFCRKSSRLGETLVLVPASDPFVHPARRAGGSENGHIIDPGGAGSRITGEAKCCPRCAKAAE